ncbi:MAG: glycosyltransferase family 9 protein [Proteobacteria bacterium]|nr:glycosyltransferase family 9 protein [Pseudomonadota bacterium]
MKTPGKDRGLLVVHRGALGDVLLALPFLAALPAHFRLPRMTLAGSPAVLGLLANQPFVSGLADVDRADWAGLHLDPPRVSERMAGFLARHAAALVVTRDPAEVLVGSLARLGLTPVLTAPSRPPETPPVHLTDWMFASTGVRPVPFEVRVRATQSGLESARRLAAEKGIDSSNALVLAPGSGGAHKNWPLESWMALARETGPALGLQPVFLLGPAEAGLAEKIESGALAVSGLTLETAAGFIASSRAFAGHDSGMTHLAARLGGPTLAVFGPTDPRRWAPRGPRVGLVQPPAAPGAWPAPETVLQALAALLSAA